MSKLRMSFACGLYDRMNALYTNEVRPEGIDLNFLVINHPRDVFDRMMGGHEFDSSEMSLSDYTCRYAAGQRDFIAIPVFPSRAFRHSFIAVNEHLVKKPKDLEGQKVGVQFYPMTAAVWIRGLLAQHGVDLDKIEWVQGAVETAGSHGSPAKTPDLLRPIKISDNTSSKSLSQMLEDGEIAATIGADLPPCFGKAPHVKRLFPDFKDDEKEYYRSHHIFPIMHTVVIKRKLYEENPFIATALFDAMNESKNLALRRMKFMGALRYMLPWLPSELDDIQEVFGDDPWPYGVEPNRATLEALIKFLHDQALIKEKVPIEDLFAPVRGNNWKI
ncbi:MAG: hypothetical protein Q9160_007931 [Pyrenula sp. 1 TL-2023]